SDDGNATRAFLRDVLGWKYVAKDWDNDWLIFKSGPSEMGARRICKTTRGITMPTMPPEAMSRPTPKMPHAQTFGDLPKPVVPKTESQITQRSESDCHRSELRHWPLDCVGPRPRWRQRLCQLCRRRRQSPGDGARAARTWPHRVCIQSRCLERR